MLNDSKPKIGELYRTQAAILVYSESNDNLFLIPRYAHVLLVGEKKISPGGTVERHKYTFLYKKQLCYFGVHVNNFQNYFEKAKKESSHDT